MENPAHSDFLLLKNMLVTTYMEDLKDVTAETHYENFRAQCIQNMTRMVVQERKRRWVESGCTPTCFVHGPYKIIDVASASEK